MEPAKLSLVALLMMALPVGGLLKVCSGGARAGARAAGTGARVSSRALSRVPRVRPRVVVPPVSTAGRAGTRAVPVGIAGSMGDDTARLGTRAGATGHDTARLGTRTRVTRPKVGREAATNADVLLDVGDDDDERSFKRRPLRPTRR
jgi:hypothetical protein